VTQHGQQQKAKQGSGNLRLVLLAAAIGIPAALLAAVFLAFVHQLEHWLWTDLPHALGASHRRWYLVLGLPVAGALAYAVSLGCGFRGPVFPAILLGVALASVAEIAFGTSPTLAMAVGTAAGMAAMTRLLFAPILFSALLVGTNGLKTVSAEMYPTSSGLSDGPPGIGSPPAAIRPITSARKGSGPRRWPSSRSAAGPAATPAR